MDKITVGTLSLRTLADVAVAGSSGHDHPSVSVVSGASASRLGVLPCVLSNQVVTDNTGVILLAEGQTYRVGRAKTNDLVVTHRNVSRFHAVLSASSSGVILSDLSSLNGTLVNDHRVTNPIDLSSGDRIVIGDVEMVLKLNLGEEPSDSSSQGVTQTAQLSAVIVSVLVVDVVGYTKISESLPPKDVVEMMNRWFQSVTQVVQKYGGTVDKYIGDCVMALWKGGSAEAGRRANAAVTAGLEILDVTEQLAKDHWPFADSQPWRCRVAVNTGEALMGTVGGGGKREFTVLGDTVNVAFRLESVAGELAREFLIGARTAGYISADFGLEALGHVTVEGRVGQLEVFAVRRQ